jgi:DNA-binding winged helix-turn-helix (wHTH) protein
MTARRVHVFGDLEVDEDLFELRARGRPLPVTPKVFDTVAFLVHNRHRVVTKDELRAAVWRGVVVTDDALQQVIRRARRLLDPRAGGAAVIDTVRGRGYRFRAPEVGRDD